MRFGKKKFQNYKYSYGRLNQYCQLKNKFNSVPNTMINNFQIGSHNCSPIQPCNQSHYTFSENAVHSIIYTLNMMTFIIRIHLKTNFQYSTMIVNKSQSITYILKSNLIYNTHRQLKQDQLKRFTEDYCLVIQSF